MIWVSRLLRGLLLIACLVVLSGIVPISITHFHTGDACPNLGPIPACYVVSLAILLAAAGATLELSGRPTCPRSDSGWPLCYSSLIVGVSLLAAFLVVLLIERRLRSA